MAGETTTPNIGLQIPAFNQANWQVPIDYDLNLLDLIFGGEIQVPALNVVDLTAVNFIVPNVLATIADAFVAETPSGSTPGTAFLCSQIPLIILAVYVNGVFQRPGVSKEYTLSGSSINFNYTVSSGDQVYVVYLKA